MRTFISTCIAMALIVGLSYCKQARGEEPWLVAWGVSYHFDRSKKQNEWNRGLGLELPLDERWSLAAGAYRNSQYRDSAYAGASWLPWRGGRARWGLAGGLVWGYEGHAMPFVVPALTVEGRGVGLNLILVPPVKNFEGVLSAQLKWRF